MTQIRTRRLLMRPMQLSDRDDLFAVFRDPRAMRYWSSLPHETAEETEALIRQTMNAPRETTADFVVEHQGRVIGKAGFWQMPEVGYILHPDFWGQGLATEAMEAVIAYGFGTRGLARITADVDPDNAASLKMLGKLGFVETGRAANTLKIGGKWFDSVYLELANPSSRASDNSV